MILTGIRLMLFLLSSLGYGVWIRRNAAGINLYFIPSLIIAFQYSMLFLSGILNMLFIVTVFLFIAGLILFLYNIPWLWNRNDSLDKVRLRMKNIPLGYLWLLLAVPVLLLAVKGHVFAHYDEFSHWGLVLQDMLITDRYPNFERTRIIFQAYPLGTATYIYYTSRIVGNAETVQMFAQAYMEICFILPVFSFMGKLYNLLYVFFVTAAANMVLCMNIPVTSLLVDTVLPLAGVTSFLWILYYDTGNRERTAEFYMILASYLTLVSQIKNSGIFFVIISGIYLIYTGRKDRFYGLRNACITLSVPFLALIIWKKHCIYVFSNASVSKHAMTLENYIRQYQAKSYSNIKKVFIDIAIRICQQRYIVGFIIFFSVVFMLLFIVNRNEFHTFKKLIVWDLLIFLTYILGIAGMYIFSMPNGEESQGLYGFERYFATIFCFLMILNIVPVAKIITELCIMEEGEYKFSDSIFVRTGICFAGLATVCLFMFGIRMKTVFNTCYNEYPRRLFENTVSEYGVSKGKSYFIVVPDGISSIGLAAKYLMISENIKSINSGGDMSDAKNYSYVIFLDDHDEQAGSWIQENYPKQEGRRVIDVMNDLWIVSEKNEAFHQGYDKEKAKLQGIDTFSSYLKAIQNEDYIVFMSVKTEGTQSLSNEEMDCLRKLGLDADIQGKFGLSFYAVIDNMDVQFEQSESSLEYEGRIDDENLDFKIISAGFRLGDCSSIILNGNEFSMNQRGFNIVVYSKKYDALIDSAAFDTYANARAYRQF